MTNIKKGSVTGNVEGILRGLGDLVERLGELAEKGEELKEVNADNIVSVLNATILSLNQIETLTKENTQKKLFFIVALFLY